MRVNAGHHLCFQSSPAVVFLSSFYLDSSQTAGDTCKWRGDGTPSKLSGNQTQSLDSKTQPDSFRFAAAIQPNMASTTSSLSVGNLRRFKALQIKCAQKKQVVSISLHKMAKHDQNVWLWTFSSSCRQTYCLKETKRRDTSRHVFRSSVVRKIKNKIKPRLDSFCESLSCPSRARTWAGQNTECMLGVERSSSLHIMNSRLLSVRLSECGCKRRQQKASAAVSSRRSHLDARSALYLTAPR